MEKLVRGQNGSERFYDGFHYFAIRASGTNDRAFPERLAYYVVIRILPWPIGAHPTSRATRVLYSTTHVSLARARARGLGRVLPYSGYFTWGLNFVVFVVGKQNTKISDTKIKCTV